MLDGIHLFSLASRKSQWASVRQATIAENVANAHTPGFRARDVEAFDRRIETGLQRQALSVALIAVGVVVLGTLGVVAFSGVELSDGLFEATSAFGTVGLSTGITATLDAASKVVLILLMLIGRVGPLTFGAALVLASHKRRYRRPSEGLMIG